MPKTVGNRERGFVDPLSLFGLLFLVVTLGAVTFVTANKDFSLNIGEKAADTGNDCFDECRKNKGRAYCNNACNVNVNWKGENVVVVDTSSIPASYKGATCDSNGKQYAVNEVVVYGGIGSYATCGSNGKWQVGVGKLADIKSENLPTYIKAPEVYQKALEEEAAAEAVAQQSATTAQQSATTAQQSADATTTDTNQVAENTSSDTVTTSQTPQPAPVKTTSTTSTANTTVQSGLTIQERRLASIECTNQGGQYQSSTGQCLKSSTSPKLATDTILFSFLAEFIAFIASVVFSVALNAFISLSAVPRLSQDNPA